MSKTRKPESSALFDLIPVRTQHIIALAVLFVLPMFLVPEVFFGGKKFFAHDTIQWRASAESVIDYRKTTGEEPLWAANQFSGMPAYLVSYARAVPHIDEFFGAFLNVIFPATPFWLTLGGAYLMFYLFGFKPFASVAGSISIAFTTYIPIIIGAGHNTKFHAYSYIPWIIASYLLFRKGDKKILAMAGLALSLNLEMRASHPQITYYFGLLIAGWWLFDTFQAYKKQEIAGWLKNTALFVLPGVILGIAANIQPYWSIAEYSPFSIRGGSAAAGTAGAGLDANYAFAWSQGWFELLTLIIPGIMGGSSATGYWGPKSVTSGPHYLGIIAFLFAIAGIWLSSRKEKNYFFGAAIVALLFSLGEHFVLFNRVMFDYFPLFNKFRTPEMWLIVTVFCGSVLMVFGIEALVEKIESSKNELKSTLLPLGVGVVIIFGLWISARTVMTFEKENEVDIIAQQVASQYGRTPDDKQLRAQISSVIQKQYVPQRADVAKSDANRALLFTILAVAIVFLAAQHTISAFWIAPFLMLITGFDMIQVGRRYMATDSMISKEMDYPDFFKRMKTPVVAFASENLKSPEGWSYRGLPIDENPFNNAVPAYFYPTVGGYSGAKMSIYQDVLNESFYTESGLNKGLLDMLNVKYITLTQAQMIPGFELAYADQPTGGRKSSGVVLENKEVLPKAWFVDSVYAVATPNDALAELRGFNPAKEAFLLEQDVFDVSRDSTASVSVTKYGPRAIELSTKNSGNGFLVMSEIYYPAGWKAFVDGTETPIYQTNYILRGVQIPAGEHTVSFRFEPASHVTSSLISWIVNALILGLVLFAVVKEKRG